MGSWAEAWLQLLVVCRFRLGKNSVVILMGFQIGFGSYYELSYARGLRNLHCSPVQYVGKILV